MAVRSLELVVDRYKRKVRSSHLPVFHDITSAFGLRVWQWKFTENVRPNWHSYAYILKLLIAPHHEALEAMD
jgi:hypothetical protein